MDIKTIIMGFIVAVLGLSLGPTIFQAVSVQTATNLTLVGVGNNVNGTTGTIAGVIPIVYYVGVLIASLGIMAVGASS